MTNPRVVSALTIAGSDSGGGAGIQADLKTFAAHGVHGLSAIAALTAQNTRGVSSVHVPPVEFLKAQIDACFDDFNIGAIKLGMLANANVIRVVADALEYYLVPPARCPVVLDPVMVATSGAKLLEDRAIAAMRNGLLPRAAILTPNIPEAEQLLQRRICNLDDMHVAARDLLGMGPHAVLLKGGHLDDGQDVTDFYLDVHGGSHVFTHPRLAVNAHGTGCTLASAIAANLCLDMSMADACASASDYIHAALRNGYSPGSSDTLVLDHFGAAPTQ
jgi:hydroxymethylpyrimidine/phosphomethylpyrimidine kinase